MVWFLIIFLGIILVLIIIAVIGSGKDKRQRQVDFVEKRENEEFSSTSHKKIYVDLYLDIMKLEEDLKNFKPSIGVKTISQINKDYHDNIKEILKSDELKEVYLIESRKEELQPILAELLSKKPVKWKSEAFFSYNLIMAKGVFFHEELEKNKEEKIINEEIDENNKLKDDQNNVLDNTNNDKIDILKEIEDDKNISITTKDEYSKLTIPQIKVILNDNNIAFNSKMKKQDLILLLEEK